MVGISLRNMQQQTECLPSSSWLSHGLSDMMIDSFRTGSFTFINVFSRCSLWLVPFLLMIEVVLVLRGESSPIAIHGGSVLVAYCIMSTLRSRLYCWRVTCIAGQDHSSSFYPPHPSPWRSARNSAHRTILEKCQRSFDWGNPTGE